MSDSVVRHSFHSIRSAAVVEALGSSGSGLAAAEARRRLEQFGYNELERGKRTTALQVMARQFKSFLVLVLVFAAAVSAALGETTDTVVIAAIVCLNAVLGFVQEFRAEKALEALRKLAAPRARVKREGQEKVIPAREVVPGDVVLFEAGDRVPADARIVEVLNLKIDESILTGESVPSDKVVEPLAEELPLADRENMAYTGTVVTYGRGEGVVVATAMETEFGKIARHIQEAREEPTPLQTRLKSLGVILGVLAIVVCLGLFGVQLLAGRPALESFMIAVALAVSAVPEGLAAVVTVALALGVRRMSGRNAIIRRLASVEALGSVTVICSDKTGTMTRDEMTVARVIAGGRSLDVTGVGYEPKGEFLENGTPVDPASVNDLSLLLQIGCLCNHATLEEREGWAPIGDPTEAALLTLAAKAGMWRAELLQRLPLVDEVPFDSQRKRMTTVHEMYGKRMAFVKGAPEMLLDLSDSIHADGSARPLTDRDRARTLEAVERLAADALRVLGFAYREIDVDAATTAADVETGLTFVGLVGMMDPPREGVRDAVARCREAGIRVVMITGDHELTAEAIAAQVGILEGGGRVMTGSALDATSDADLADVVEEIAVYARTSPEHKVRVLEALKSRGHVVSMTGDGVNDAPAVKRADVGVAMGIKGTDVTREASDVVLADDNFATIVAAVEEGRGIYDNIRKFIRLLLSTNVDEIMLVAGATLLRLPLPLLPIQVLWVNVISDGLPALALSFDPYEKDVMRRRPRSPREGVFHHMVLFILVAAAIDFLMEMGLLITWGNTGFVSLERLRTIIFTSTVLFELFFVFNCRSESRSVFRKNPFENRPLVLAVAVSLLLQVAVIYVPFLQALFETVALRPSDWLLILAMSASGLLVLPEVLMRRGVLRARRAQNPA